MNASSRVILLPLLVFLLLSQAHAGPTEDLKIAQLEQDVRELQRLVQQQSRRLEMLETAARSRATPAIAFGERSTAPNRESRAPTRWLQNAQWDTLRLGMSEIEVLELLGPPTTARASDGIRTLFYTLELEAGGFLSGRVIIDAGRTVEIHKPALR